MGRCVERCIDSECWLVDRHPSDAGHDFVLRKLPVDTGLDVVPGGSEVIGAVVHVAQDVTDLVVDDNCATALAGRGAEEPRLLLWRWRMLWCRP